MMEMGSLIFYLQISIPVLVDIFLPKINQIKRGATNVISYILIHMPVYLIQRVHFRHELQHLIHYNYDSYEEIQFNEGLSEMATMICGGDYISHAHYLSQADQMGWGWDSDASYYAMASLFTLYYVEQLGDGAIKDFIKINAGNNPLQGWRAFDQLLSNYGTGKTHREWLVDWYTANYIDNKLINPKYGYDQWLPMRAKLTAKHLSGKIESTENKVLGYGPIILFMHLPLILWKSPLPPKVGASLISGQLNSTIPPP